MAVPLQWEGSSVPRHIETVETAHRQFDFLPQALQRVYAPEGVLPILTGVVLTPLATGGAMAVYKLTAKLAREHSQHVVCKIPHDRRIVYASSTVPGLPLETTEHLLERLVHLAQLLAQRAPGLFPRCGGVWHWESDDGAPRHLLVEEYIPGLSIERIKYTYDQQLTAGELSAEAYNQRCRKIERLAVATFVRLWNCLDRRAFTSDPSPWNILVPPSADWGTLPPLATIIDLHSLEEEVGLSYVVQRLAAVYGLRQEVLEQAIVPGVLDALGREEGRSMLLDELLHLEAEAHKTVQNLGVDLQRPLLEAIRTLQ